MSSHTVEQHDSPSFDVADNSMDNLEACINKYAALDEPDLSIPSFLQDPPFHPPVGPCSPRWNMSLGAASTLADPMDDLGGAAFSERCFSPISEDLQTLLIKDFVPPARAGSGGKSMQKTMHTLSRNPKCFNDSGEAFAPFDMQKTGQLPPLLRPADPISDLPVAAPPSRRRLNDVNIQYAAQPLPKRKRSGRTQDRPAATPAPYRPKFHASTSFQGSRNGYAFRMGDRGLGYYEDHRCPHPRCPHTVEPQLKRMHHHGRRTYLGGTCPAGHECRQCFENDRHAWSEAVVRGRKRVHQCSEGCPRKVLCDYCSAVFENYRGSMSYHPKEACPHFLAQHPEIISPAHLHQLKRLQDAGVFERLNNPKYEEQRQDMLARLNVSPGSLMQECSV